MPCGQRKRERPLSSSRLSPRKLHIMVRGACESLGSCRKVTVAPSAITVWPGICTHLPSLHRYRAIFAVVPFAYRRHYLHVHVASPIAVSLPLIRELVRSTFVSRTDCSVNCICRFVSSFINAYERGNVWPFSISCTKDGNY